MSTTYTEVSINTPPARTGWYFITGSEMRPREYGRAFYYAPTDDWKAASFDLADCIKSNSEVYWLKPSVLKTAKP